MERPIVGPVQGGALAAHGAEIVDARFGALRLRRGRIPPCWETQYLFRPEDRVITLRFEANMALEPPSPDQALFLDYLESRFGLAMVLVLPAIKRALGHYVKPTVLRIIPEEFRLAWLTVPADPCSPRPVYELGYRCLSDPTLSFAAVFTGALRAPWPRVTVRVDRDDDAHEGHTMAAPS